MQDVGKKLQRIQKILVTEIVEIPQLTLNCFDFAVYDSNDLLIILHTYFNNLSSEKEQHFALLELISCV